MFSRTIRLCRMGARLLRHILDMAGGERRDLTVWEKTNLHLAKGAPAANGLAFAWVDLEALAGPADIAAGCDHQRDGASH